MIGGVRLAGERGSGSVLAVGLIAAVTIITVVLVPVASGLAGRSSVAAAADLAALAAADVAVGLAPGIPCELAATVASTNGATLRSCTVDGLIVTVVVGARVLGVDVTAAATAGPPGS